MRTSVNAWCLVASMALAALASPASAQDPNAPVQTVMVDPNAQQQPMVLAQPMRVDGVRFRYGFDGAVGAEWVNLTNYGSATMFGLDLRLGVQINDRFGVYAAPHLSLGSFGGVLGLTGTFVFTAVADYTLSDRVSFGAGFGWGQLNNPSGPALHVRVAAYPLVTIDPGKPRRRALALALDLRTVFADGVTGTLLMGSIGYEAF